MRLPLLAIAFLGSSATAQDWPHWRGPSFDGSTDVTGLPTDFSKSKHVQWAAALPGPSAGTPIVLGQRVFVSSVDTELQNLLAMCLDLETGEELWVDAAGSGHRPGDQGTETYLHNRSNYASPSPVTDGERVVFSYGNGDMVAYTLEGERLWERNLQLEYGGLAFQWTFSASPTLWKGVLYLPILQRNSPVRGIGRPDAPSFLLAIDAETGETRFEHVRPSDALVESLESYATPIPHVGPDGRAELIVVGGDVITGHDPESGEELWRWGTWNPGHRERSWRLVPSPVVGAGVVLACGPKGAPVTAVRLGGKGLLDDGSVAWQSDGRRDPVTTDVPTPLFYDGDFFVLSDLRESLTRVDAKTGKQRWTVKLEGDYKWRASPTGADGKLWIQDHGGVVHVFDAATGELLQRAELGEPDDDNTRSSIAISHGSLFVRTHSKLYRIGM